MLNGIKTNYYESYAITEREKIVELQKSRRNRVKARMKIYFIKQKLSGVLMIVLGCVVVAIDNTVGMAAIVCIAIGIGLIVTRQMVMMFKR